MHPSKYEIILKVEETGSFTKTAEYYQYTQSAISQAVKSIETELGIALFRRTPSGITLSDEGAYVLPSIREIVTGQRHLAEQTNELHELKTGTIRLGAYPSLSCHWLPSYIKKFNSLYPGVHFELYQLDDSHLLEYIQKDLIDLAFMSDPCKKSYNYRELFEDPFMIIVSENHPASDRKYISLNELKNEGYIFIEVGYKDYFNRMFNDAGFVPDVKYRMIDDISVLSMVENGFGISILPKLATLRTTYRIRMIKMKPSYSRQLGIVTNKNAYLSWAVRTFIRFVHDEKDMGVSL